MRLKIESPSNHRLKVTRALESRQGVLKHGAFIVEGPRFVSDSLSLQSPGWLVLSEGASPAASTVAERAEGSGVVVLEVPGKIFRDLSDTVHSQGLLAVCPLPTTAVEDVPEGGCILLLDGLSDPGNMGTLIRSAAAFGCAAVLVGKGSCCPFIPKVTRAAAGTSLMLPVIFDLDIATVMGGMKENRVFYGAEASGGPAELLQLGGSGVGLVIGSEAHGISAETREYLTESIAIPMSERVESLNAATSGSILLYLLTR